MTRKTTLFNLLLLFCLLLMTARYLIIGWNRILLNSNSAEGDQSVYLQLGLDIRERGMLTDGKRHPLYPLLLATFAAREWQYFTWAKIINLGIGLLTIWALFLIGKRLFDPLTGLVAAFLLSINIEFVFHNTFALTEALLILLFLLAWFTMVRALQEPERLKYWIAAGGLSGLAYLAKGTGPLIALCFMLTATLLYRLRMWRQRAVWSFIGAFCLVSLPLWLFNWFHFGSPLFNSTFTNVIWLDSAADKYVATPDALPTLSTYLQEKSPLEMWERLWAGLSTMRYFFTRILWPTRTLVFDSWFQSGRIDFILVLFALVLLLIWLLARPVFKRHRASLLLTAVLAAVYYLLFGWYIAITPFPIRFLLTLLPMLYLLLAAGVVGLVKGLFAAPKIPAWAKAAVGVAVFLLLLRPIGWFGVTGWLIAQGSQRNAFAADAEFNGYIDQPFVWTQTGHTGEAVTVMWGPTHMLPTWKHSRQLNLVRTPVAEVKDSKELEAFMAAANVAYVIADRQMVDRLGSDMAAELGLRKSGDARIEFANYPSDWALGFVAPEMPCQWCVFRRISAASPPIESANYMLGESIKLFGYEILADEFYPGGQIVVTLYWASAQPVSTDYTIFTQLLGPDFQLRGQLDRQPLSGRWPTSRWQPGQKFVDKFVLNVSEFAPTGDYVLLVGLYDVNTGQRLPVTTHGERLQDDAIRLVNLTIPAPPQ
jgi:4-amino-4-deoxy-L-arabinose transferase-like glycosyltransferase